MTQQIWFRTEFFTIHTWLKCISLSTFYLKKSLSLFPWHSTTEGRIEWLDKIYIYIMAILFWMYSLCVYKKVVRPTKTLPLTQNFGNKFNKVCCTCWSNGKMSNIHPEIRRVFCLVHELCADMSPQPFELYSKITVFPKIFVFFINLLNNLLS